MVRRLNGPKSTNAMARMMTARIRLPSSHGAFRYPARHSPRRPHGGSHPESAGAARGRERDHGRSGAGGGGSDVESAVPLQRERGESGRGGSGAGAREGGGAGPSTS